MKASVLAFARIIAIWRRGSGGSTRAATPPHVEYRPSPVAAPTLCGRLVPHSRPAATLAGGLPRTLPRRAAPPYPPPQPRRPIPRRSAGSTATNVPISRPPTRGKPCPGRARRTRRGRAGAPPGPRVIRTRPARRGGRRLRARRLGGKNAGARRPKPRPPQHAQTRVGERAWRPLPDVSPRAAPTAAARREKGRPRRPRCNEGTGWGGGGEAQTASTRRGTPRPFGTTGASAPARGTQGPAASRRRGSTFAPRLARASARRHVRPSPDHPAPCS
ncbi:hypothetical protein BU14_0431s0002 [Porphyra umbilicalis]|uniref:Uncharacterized protein n=1 Tax=Porphyra umbilicalis TaxID=2786 RepID=A0A1X6NV35_PORUM|nr:hypothetical protein BU14_0431s0002 [Porphyra umbilicalis]|eukprot:OSX72478.1 hypothetical protein BU14_0431s0002 [Porphyra umbilicalis]